MWRTQVRGVEFVHRSIWTSVPRLELMASVTAATAGHSPGQCLRRRRWKIPPGRAQAEANAVATYRPSMNLFHPLGGARYADAASGTIGPNSDPICPDLSGLRRYFVVDARARYRAETGKLEYRPGDPDNLHNRQVLSVPTPFFRNGTFGWEVHYQH